MGEQIDAVNLSRAELAPIMAGLADGSIVPATRDAEGTPYPEVNRPVLQAIPAPGHNGEMGMVYKGRLPMDRRVRVAINITTERYELLFGAREW